MTLWNCLGKIHFLNNGKVPWLLCCPNSHQKGKQTQGGCPKQRFDSSKNYKSKNILELIYQVLCIEAIRIILRIQLYGICTKNSEIFIVKRGIFSISLLVQWRFWKENLRFGKKWRKEQYSARVQSQVNLKDSLTGLTPNGCDETPEVQFGNRKPKLFSAKLQMYQRFC